MAKKAEKGHYARERDAKAAALKRGLKIEEYEIVSGPKGFSIREKRKHVPVPGAKLHVGPDAEKTIKEVLNEPVEGHENIFLDKSNNRYRYADETQDLSQESFETIEAAQAALKKYLNHMFSPGEGGEDEESVPSGTIRASEQVATEKEAELEKKFPMNPPDTTPETPAGVDPELDKMRTAQDLHRQVDEGKAIGTAKCPKCQSTIPMVELKNGEERFTDHGNPETDDDCPNSYELVEGEVKPLSPPSSGVSHQELKPHELAQIGSPVGVTAQGQPTTRVRKSTVESPSKLVWHIADEMIGANPQVTRKEVIQACIDRGIATFTARTQYQAWFKTRRESIQHAAEVNAKK